MSRLRLASLCLFIASIIIFLVPHKTVQAVNFTVNALTPYAVADGLCSIAEAIDNANDDAQTHADCPAGAGADVITLTNDITLDGSTIFNTNGENGLPSITSDITIEGNDFTIQRANGAPAFRILHVSAGGDLNLNRVTISNGQISSGFNNGGGIFNLGNLTLTNSTAQNNRVDSIFPSGGGIYNDTNGNLTLIDSIILNNSAVSTTSVFDYGGGIYSQGILTLLGTRVQDNYAEENGGGIWANNNTTINNSLITGNYALNGGGLHSAGALAPPIFRITNTTFSNNTAVELGGAMMNGADDVEIFGSTFSGNRALGNPNGGGGAIYNLGGIMQITASRLLSNQTLNNAVGGAIANTQLGEITLRASIVSGNSSATNGGGLYTTLAPFTIVDSLIDGNSANGGGGLYEAPSNVDGFTIVRTTVSNNSASFIGGGLLNEGNQSTSTIINSTFTGNVSPTFGGGIGLNAGGLVDILHSTFAENTSTQFTNSVGGINAFAGTMTIGSSIIANNLNADCSATNASTSLDYNLTTGVAGGIPIDRWCSFVPIQPNDLTTTNPLLNPLGNYGNLGQTYTLQAGSAAIDYIPVNCPPELDGVDQRGVPREVGSCDVGAVSSLDVILPEIYFETPSTLIDNEGTVTTQQTINLVIDNTNGTLPAPGTLPLTIYVSLTGTSTPTTDYTTTLTTPSTFTINAGNWVAPGNSQIITIPIDVLDDTIYEGDETIQLSLLLSGPGVIDPNRASHIVTIIDDELPPINVVDAGNQNPQISLFDPAISKLGFLVPNEIGAIGEQIEWVITVSNTGNIVGENVIISDILLPELRIDDVTTSKGTINVTGQSVEIAIGELAVGESVQISIFTTVIDGTFIVPNIACVNASNQAIEACATALPITALPTTGETPIWRLPIFLLGLACMILSAFIAKYQKLIKGANITRYN